MLSFQMLFILIFIYILQLWVANNFALDFGIRHTFVSFLLMIPYFGFIFMLLICVYLVVVEILKKKGFIE